MTALDGVRGVAACVVVISHLIAGFYPALFFGAPDEARFALQHAIANSPLFVLYSGTFAVYIFFVLSGFVIAASAMRTRCGLLVLALTRYLRLAVPVLASVLLALALMWAFPGAPQRASAIVGNWWLDFMGPDGREQTLYILGPGEPFCLCSLVDIGEYPAFAAALVETRVLSFPAARLVQAAREEPELLFDLMGLMDISPEPVVTR